SYKWILPQGLGGAFSLVSSFLVTVPSGDWVTVFSFDLTVPSLLVVVVSDSEIVRSHPVSRNDKAKADTADKHTILLFIGLLSRRASFGYGAYPCLRKAGD